MGAIGSLSPQNAKERITSLRAATKGPFFVNMILQLLPTNPPEVLAPCLEAGAPIIQFSWGVPAREAVSMVRAAGARFGMQVTSGESARVALDAGADFLVCQGTEAGGHVQAHRGLYEALPAVLEEAKEKPVIAAGGIGNGAGIYRALKAGASAALLGTRFVATQESNAHTNTRKRWSARKLPTRHSRCAFKTVGWRSIEHCGIRPSSLGRQQGARNPASVPAKATISLLAPTDRMFAAIPTTSRWLAARGV
jgi:nitronate monooxygenase